MINLNFLHHIYQQWSHGRSNADLQWIDFVELAARLSGASKDSVVRELQKTYWFKWPNE